jgi:23S rRNA (uracil1939-C5)-methyltransferase
VAGRSLQPGDELEASCRGLDDLGAGLFEIRSEKETLRLHVAGALPGESVRARIDHVSPHAQNDVREAWGELRDVLCPSSDRVKPLCPIHSRCGSCPLMNLTATTQSVWKQSRVAARFSEQPELAGVEVEPCVPSPRSTGYRNQAKYVYGRALESGQLVLGAFAPRSHALVDLAGCRVVEPILDQVAATCLLLLVANQVLPFDEVRRTGILRYVMLRATDAGQVLVTLVASRPDWALAHTIANELAGRCPAVIGVVLNVNPSRGNVLFGNEERLLCGHAMVEDDIGDVRVRLSSRSFFQTNRLLASQIYRDLTAAVPEGVARAVDVYTGAAGIALSLATKAQEVVAIEENQAATQAAAAFIAERGAGGGRVRMVTGDAALNLAQIDVADLVVLNPPRKGCSAEVLAAVSRLKPKILAYLSCDPQTLVRDLAVLVRACARVRRVTPYDMMPYTPHVETLALLGWASPLL